MLITQIQSEYRCLKSLHVSESPKYLGFDGLCCSSVWTLSLLCPSHTQISSKHILPATPLLCARVLAYWLILLAMLIIFADMTLSVRGENDPYLAFTQPLKTHI